MMAVSQTTTKCLALLSGEGFRPMVELQAKDIETQVSSPGPGSGFSLDIRNFKLNF